MINEFGCAASAMGPISGGNFFLIFHPKLGGSFQDLLISVFPGMFCFHIPHELEELFHILIGFTPIAPKDNFHYFLKSGKIPFFLLGKEWIFPEKGNNCVVE